VVEAEVLVEVSSVEGAEVVSPGLEVVCWAEVDDEVDCSAEEVDEVDEVDGASDVEDSIGASEVEEVVGLSEDLEASWVVEGSWAVEVERSGWVSAEVVGVTGVGEDAGSSTTGAVLPVGTVEGVDGALAVGGATEADDMSATVLWWGLLGSEKE